MQSNQQAILNRLINVRRRMRSQLAIEGIAWFLLAAFVLGVVSFIADWYFELGRSTRIVFALASLASLGYVAARYVIGPLTAKWEPMDIAGAIDLSGFKSVDQAISPKVATLFQLSDTTTSVESNELIEEAAKRSYLALEKIDFENRIDTRHRNRSWMAMGAGILLPLWCIALIPIALTSTWFTRWFTGSDVAWPRNTKIEIVGVVDNQLMVPRDEPLEIEFVVSHKRGAVPDRLRMEFRSPGRKPERISLVHDSQRRFLHELPGVSERADLKVWAGDGKLGPVEIVPVDRPRLIGVRLNHQHPWNEKTQTHDFDGGDGSVSLLPKTKAELTLTSNVALESVYAEWNLEGVPNVSRLNDSTFQLSWEQNSETQINIELIGREVGLRSELRSISVGLKKDSPPTVTLSPDGIRRRVTPTANLPLHVVAQDDFGISSLKLASVVEQPMNAESEPIDQQATESSASQERVSQNQSDELLFGPADPAVERLLDINHEFSLAELKLDAGNTVRMRATVVDGCYLGSQAAESPWLTFAIVKPQELFQEILARQQQMRTRLQKATERATDMRDKLATSQFPKAAKELLREHKLNQREVTTVQRALAESVREMELNQLGGQESIDLIRENVVKPLEALADSQMNQQRSAIEQLDQEGNSDPADAMQRQEKIVDEMNRVLKNMNQWDSFVDVVNQLDAVIDLQKKLKDATDQLKEQDAESIFED